MSNEPGWYLTGCFVSVFFVGIATGAGLVRYLG